MTKNAQAGLTIASRPHIFIYSAGRYLAVLLTHIRTGNLGEAKMNQLVAAD